MLWLLSVTCYNKNKARLSLHEQHIKMHLLYDHNQGRSDGRGDIGIYPPPKKISPSKLFMG